MARKTYPKGTALIKMFIETIGNYDGFKVIRQDAICQFLFDGCEYYAYFKCVTHEGNPYPLEHQRAQLPYRDEFNEIRNSAIPFLFFGYDVDNDVFVCWEPHKIKPRLNRKSYVSFYSRLSVQQSVEEGKIKEETLTNGDKFVLFKRTDLIPFLQMIDSHFPEIKISPIAGDANHPQESSNLQDSNGLQGRIMDVVDDAAVRLLVDSFPEDTPTLTIVGECLNQFGTYYEKMHFSDWGKIVRTYLYNKQCQTSK